MQLLDDGWLRYGSGEWTQLGHEVAIRHLIRLQVDDDAAVAEFIGTHGIINEQADVLGSRILRPRNHPGPPVDAHINDAQRFLVVARCLARHWIADRLGEDVAPGWQELFPAPVPEITAWESFAKYLTIGLTPFHARVEFSLVGSRDEMSVGRPRVHLYSALCHQLFGLYAENAPVMRCANERCDQAFSRQEGRAMYGQYRTEGVLYCSNRCARAELERRRRRRMKGDAR